MENYTEEQVDHMKGVIESLLFVNEKPVTLEQLAKVLETINNKDVKHVIKLLIEEYQEKKRGMTIVEIAGGYQMLSNSLYASYIRSFYKTKHKEKLSKPSLETAAIIAYKQPVTRSDVELIRGVNSDGVFANLLKKELIKIVGRKDVPGKPYVYGTTRQFLEYFGLKSLNDLPKLQEDFSKLPKYQEKEAEKSIEDKKDQGGKTILDEQNDEEVVSAQEDVLDRPMINEDSESDKTNFSNENKGQTGAKGQVQAEMKSEGA